jgi:hypothetical protein
VLVAEALSRFACVFLGVLTVAMGQMRMVCALARVIVLQVLGSFFVVRRRVPVVLGSLFMVLVMGATGFIVHSHRNAPKGKGLQPPITDCAIIRLWKLTDREEK